MIQIVAQTAQIYYSALALIKPQVYDHTIVIVTPLSIVTGRSIVLYVARVSLFLELSLFVLRSDLVYFFSVRLSVLFDYEKNNYFFVKIFKRPFLG